MSGFIYLVIIGMWAAYLLPMWLRRNEPAADTERLGTAMRVLARRPREHQDGSPTPTAEPDAVTVEVPVAEQGASLPPRDPDVGHSRLVVRRRRLLFVLLVTTVILVALHAAGVVDTTAVAVVALLLLADLVHLRVQARRRAELAHRRSRAHRAAARRRRVQRAPAHLDRSEVGSGGATEPVADGTWEPRPVPLPTYVTAPKAPAASHPPAAEEQDDRGPGTWAPPAPEPYGDADQEPGEPDSADPLFERRVVND